LISVAGIAIVAIVVTLGAYLINKKEKRTQLANAYTGQLAPLTRESDGSITMAKAGVTAPLLEVFEDFQCPVCQQFEKTSGDTIKKLAAEGKVKVVYRPFQLFQQDPQAANTKRAAMAALCAPADKWISYHDALYKYQPAEGTNGFSTKNLKLWAKDLGFEDAAFDKCVDDKQKASQLTAITNYTVKQRGVTGTPTVFLNGKSLSLETQLMSASGLQQAITAAGATASPPASGSPSASPAK
jgi:protein-disulfide isomerase